MATVQIEIDDTILADFYEAVGAHPDPSWAEADQKAWLKIVHLEPYLLNSLAAAGRRLRHTRAMAQANQQNQTEEAALGEVIRQHTERRMATLPAKIRPTADTGQREV